MKVSYQASSEQYLIVGSNSDIGIELIHTLSLSGAELFGIDIQPKCHDSVVEKLEYCQVDPKDESQMEVVANTWLSTNVSLSGIIVLSGAIRVYDRFLNTSKSDWEETYHISFSSAFNACQKFHPLLRADVDTSVVLMSSGLAFGGMKNYGPYSTAKSSVNTLMKTLANEWAPNIRVNSVAPGGIDTKFLKNEKGVHRINKEQYIRIVPQKRLGKPQEVAAVILFLLSESSSHITGQCIHINGGALML